MGPIPFPQMRAPSQEDIAEFRRAGPSLVEETLSDILANTKAREILGDGAEDVLRSGLTFMVKTLDGIMISTSVTLLRQQLEWGLTYLATQGVPAGMVLKNFQIFEAVLNRSFPDRPILLEWGQLMTAEQTRLTAR